MSGVHEAHCTWRACKYGDADCPVAGPLDWLDELQSLADMASLRVVFGLRQQGHIQLIAQMLLDGDDWADIGNAIGWCPKTARKHWGWLCEVPDCDPTP